ncbi:methylenetetrahydrofolate reductase [NAD(P)H] [Clostridium oryzae]|uniref:Methylenetetrahydrofolate reductase n=1 Tax=Clostridium oryzae TaxID=1450648 RepID=A0A1V4II32_9CLOT|nr:methylenetetrahydrofolate reductase [NAD(P)H] [Clostridium oryzae]OPJ59335.1 5,10-methylenetetrahydrofolate reductase [Clostridium oryzae]
MLIKNIFKSKKTVISFEIFPPKKDNSIDTIYDTIDALKDLKPDFISVTYGAGGSTRDKTIEIASIIKNKYYIESLAHLTCIALTEDRLKAFLNEVNRNNINNIMALRGDLPADTSENLLNFSSYHYASDLVKYIKTNSNLGVGGACYPEGHFECKSVEDDVENLKIKVNNGADFLITQLFFDTDRFYDFKDLAVKNGINVPVSAGIMPVTNAKQIQRMISLSGASVPSKLSRILAKYENNPAALKEAGIAYATEQIIDLLSWGVDGIHIYTMNRPEICRKLIQNISSIRETLATAK